ncbi:CDP-glycerol glycerophosphotransferase family protein [Candidatus Woesearchaeota archaeon]|nr:CDP-glycerol glycerophosphotransferase family protein [Candidatus Woesearchaeota archaeon]
MAKKRLFFLREENLNHIKKPLKNDIIILLNGTGKNCLASNLEGLASENTQTIYGYGIRWTQKWAFSKLASNKSFAEELVFRNISLWYFIEFLLHRIDKPYMNEHPISKMLLYLDYIEKIITKAKPFEVIVENKKTDFNRLLIKMCKKHRIKTVNLGLRERKKSIGNLMTNNLFILKAYLKSRIALRIIVGKFFCKRLPRKKILILTSTRLSNKQNSTDFFWGPLIKEMDRARLSYKVIEYDHITNLNSLKTITERYIPQKYDAEFIGKYYDARAKKNTKAVVMFLKKKFKELEKRSDFKRSLTYRGINFYEIIKKRLKKIFLAYAPYIGDVYALGASIIEKEKPDLILIDHEKNYYGKALLFQSNNQKKKTSVFSLEGEAVYDTNTKLVQVPIKETLNRRSPVWRPIADKKFVSGEYSFKWHKEKYYLPPQNLKITGSPKYDFLNKITAEEKQSIFKKYGVKPDEKLITVIAWDWPGEEEFLRGILNALKGMRAVYVIIKQHPEDSDANKKYIKKMLEEYKVKGNVTRDENTSSLICAAELVITINSTVVNECILMDKKTILYEPKEDDWGRPWIKEGLTQPQVTSAKLEKAIKSSFSKKKLFDRSLREKYINKYFFSDDGKASKRVVQEIKKMLST